MVLLHRTKLGKVWKIIYYKSIHNTPYICFHIAFFNRHGLMEGWAPISNQEKETLSWHTSHPVDMKT